MNCERARILIIDDEKINIQVMSAALRDVYDIDTANSGIDAILKARSFIPDLILLDVMMPDLNGFEVCKILKSDEVLAHIPVIFLTAMDTVNAEKEGLEAGGIDYLAKPVNIDLIRLRVKNHIELVRSRNLIRTQYEQLACQKEELEATISRIKHLEGILTICMYCKQIRDTGNTWRQLESYISEHSDALFSHGMCPACLEREIAALNAGNKSYE